MCWNKLIINVLHQIGCHTGWRDTFTSAHSKFIGRESIMVENDDERKIFLAWIIPWMSFFSLSPCWFMLPRICMNNFFVCHFHHIKIFIILYYKLYHWHAIVAKMTTINAQCTSTAHLVVYLKVKKSNNIVIAWQWYTFVPSFSTLYFQRWRLCKNDLIEKHNLWNSCATKCYT